ncbi:MAG: hypothetical protein WC845_00945 [Candidatus Staskawiczbacteria bacterium]|jgi:hypothetical protein
MENNTHLGETKEKRLKRFQDGPPYEIIATLLNSIANFFNNEIVLTTQANNFQTSLLFLGVHAVALTVSEGLFDKKGLEGYKLFLERFVDGDTPDTKFSTIAELIHNWRNVLAHQWIGSIGHEVGYDYTMSLGWEIRGENTFINPRIYLEHYLAAFNANGKIWGWEKLLTDTEKEESKKRLIEKYLKQ